MDCDTIFWIHVPTTSFTGETVLKDIDRVIGIMGKEEKNNIKSSVRGALFLLTDTAIKEVTGRSRALLHSFILPFMSSLTSYVV